MKACRAVYTTSANRELCCGPGVHDLLLVSDLHLGSHLKPRMRGESVHLASRIEETFPRFIDHYLREGRWQLVVNGDFIDFWNIELEGSRGAEGERLAVRRLHAVLDAHPAVEDALARFVRAGNGIVFVTGNHDAELLYPGVRAALAGRIESLSTRTAAAMAGEGPVRRDDADITRTDAVRLRDLSPGRVGFVRWFLREEGGAWIEHGHAFDPSCATPAKLSPTRGGELVMTVAEVATRSFANLMPEIDYDAPDKFGARDYVRWAVARGWRFVIRVILLGLRTFAKILALGMGPGRVDRAGRADHRARLERVAALAGLQMTALQALEKMAPPPSGATVGGLFRITALDQLFAIVGPLVLGALVGRAFGSSTVGSVVGLALGVIALVRVRRGRRRRNVARDMLEVAASVGEVTGVPLVLMGHSHRGSLERLGDVVYANSGSWLDGSHLVVRRDRETGRLLEVELRRWRNGGITRSRRMSVPQPPRADDDARGVTSDFGHDTLAAEP
jgi:UDP-2,3-diacylglucosamine pyrophosphatase LpxH